jgi:hypothetical protein
MKATDFIRAIDASDLDPYEMRYLIRVWRRGTCWEKLTSIAESTGMSLGKASQVRRDLVEKGWLVMVEEGGRIAYQVAVPGVEDVHEVKVSVVEFHDMKQEFHEVKPEFHDMSALPINRPKEDHSYKQPVDELREYFVTRTTIQPNSYNGAYEQNWREPLSTILAQVSGDVDRAKGLIDASLEVAWGSGGGKTYPVSSPKSIRTIAINQAATQRNVTAASDSETIWRRAIDAIARGTFDDERLRAAIRAVGAEKIQTATERTAEGLKGRLAHEYHRIAVPA